MYGFGYGGGRAGDGIELVTIGLLITAGGLFCFHRSFISWHDAFNSTSRNLSAYTMIVGFVILIAGLGCSYYGFDIFQNWLDTHHEYVNDSEIPLQILGHTFQFSLSQYGEAFELGGFPSLQFAFSALLGIYIILGSTGAIIRRDFLIVPMKIHMYGAIYGVIMALLMVILLYHWVNNIAVAIYDGEHMMNSYDF